MGNAKAVADAHDHGVKVTAILDKSNQTEKYNPAKSPDNAGVLVFIDAERAIAHNKIMLIRRRDDHHGLVQLHQRGRVAQRRNPADHPATTRNSLRLTRITSHCIWDT